MSGTSVARLVAPIVIIAGTFVFLVGDRGSQRRHESVPGRDTGGSGLRSSEPHGSHRELASTVLEATPQVPNRDLPQQNGFLLGSECSLALHVRSASREPVPSAVISAFGADGSFLVGGATDSDGYAILRLGSYRDVLSVSVGALSYATEWLSLQCPIQRVLPITLVPSSYISGLVYFHGELAPDSAVYAYPETHLQLDKKLDPRVLRAISNAKGEFTIDDVRPGVHYAVRAGRVGRLSEPILDVQAGAERLELHLKGVFAALVSLRDPNGQVPRGALSAATIRADPASPAGSVQLGQDAVPLAGVSQHPRGGDRGYDQFLACLSDSVEPSLGPIHVYLEAPGYYPSERDVWLHALGPQEVPAYEVTLEPLGESACARIRLERLPGDFNNARMVWPQMILWLVKAHGPPIEIPLLELIASQEACGIPLGEYAVQATMTHAHYQKEMAASVVFGREPSATEIVVDCGDLGAVRLEVESPNGTPYTGMLTLNVAEDYPHAEQQGTVNFAQAPYSLLLPKGRFSFQVGLPKFLTEAGEYRVLGFEPQVGVTTVLALSP